MTYDEHEAEERGRKDEKARIVNWLKERAAVYSNSASSYDQATGRDMFEAAKVLERQQ